MFAPGPFPNLSWSFLSWWDGADGPDADPALRPIRGAAGGAADRGFAAGTVGPAALRLPRAQPAAAHRPRRAPIGRIRRRGAGGPPRPVQRAALEAAPRRGCRAADRACADRTRAAGERVRGRRGGTRGAPSGGVARREGGVGPGLGSVRPGLRHREPATAPRPRPPVAGRLEATPRRRPAERARVPRGGEPWNSAGRSCLKPRTVRVG